MLTSFPGNSRGSRGLERLHRPPRGRIRGDLFNQPDDHQCFMLTSMSCTDRPSFHMKTPQDAQPAQPLTSPHLSTAHVGRPASGHECSQSHLPIIQVQLRGIATNEPSPPDNRSYPVRHGQGSRLPQRLHTSWTYVRHVMGPKRTKTRSAVWPTTRNTHPSGYTAALATS